MKTSEFRKLIREEVRRVIKESSQSSNEMSRLNKLYGRIYDFTDIAGDSALELMDKIIDKKGLTDELSRFLDDSNLSASEAKNLARALAEVLDELKWEYGK